MTQPDSEPAVEPDDHEQAPTADAAAALAEDRAHDRSEPAEPIAAVITVEPEEPVTSGSASLRDPADKKDAVYWADFWGRLGFLAVAAALIIFAFASGQIVVTVTAENLRQQAILGITVIVTFGAVGLFLRGLGEIFVSKAKWLKASGYFAGGLAYIATASISLSSAFQLVQFGK